MRASFAAMVKSRSASSGLKVAPSPMGCEKLVASSAAWPWRHSSWKMTGMPRREFSTKNFWMAFDSSAVARARRPLPASLGRPTWPSPRRSLNAFLALARSNAPSASTSVSDLSRQTHIIWAAFSSRVIRESRSFVRRAGGSAGFRYAGAGVFLLGALVADGMMVASFWALTRIHFSVELYLDYNTKASTPSARASAYLLRHRERPSARKRESRLHFAGARKPRAQKAVTDGLSRLARAQDAAVPLSLVRQKNSWVEAAEDAEAVGFSLGDCRSRWSRTQCRRS